MNEEKPVTVSLRDLCDISIAVAGLTHDLEDDGLYYPYTDIDAVHGIVEEWASDKRVLGGGCHSDHRCSFRQDRLGYADRTRRSHRAEKRMIPGRHPGEELTAGLSARLEMGGTSTHNLWGDEFLLEHISEAVVRVTHCLETGYFGLKAESHTSDRPYTRTWDDCEVVPAGIGGRHVLRSFTTPKAALDSTCAMILGESSTVDSRLFDAFAEERLPRPGRVEDTTISYQGVLAVRLSDLCTIADAMGTMQHDLDNGKTKNLYMEIARIHSIVESWAQDENVLAGAGCHDDHRCRFV